MTEPGDWVLDPFMGGGTTIVEAIASGRQAVGTDVNALSQFVTKTKTTPLSNRDRTEVRDWVYCVWKEMAGASHSVQPNQPLIRNLPAEVYPFFAAGPVDSLASCALRDAGDLPIALCWESVSWCWTARRTSQVSRRCAIGSRGTWNQCLRDSTGL